MDQTLKNKTIAYYNSNPGKYAEYVDKFYSTEQISSFLSILPDNPRVLDVGSGSGRDAHVMTQGGAKVTGIDLAEGLVDFARSKYPEIEFIVGDMTNMNLPDNTFDGVWCHAVLFHLETEAEVLQTIKEFHRVLKPGGYLHVLVKHHKQGSKVKVYTDQESGHSRVYRFFTKEELENILESSGFDTVILETYDENERNPEGRSDVTWLHSLSKKKTS